MIERFLSVFFVAAIASLLFTPLVMQFAHIIKAIDHPNRRKIHANPTPRLGGLAVIASFVIAISLFFRSDSVTIPWQSWSQGIVLGLTGILVLGLGIWDDIKQLSSGKKFVLQAMIATIVFFSGVRIEFVSHPFNDGIIDLGLMSYPATILWIVGVMNAINLIDGLDGLASGVSIIALLTIAAVGFLKFSDTGTALLSIALTGALFGFLRYNFHPAKIFLGDSGSLFIGFALAILSLLSFTKGPTAFAVCIPVLALGLPIFDTSLVMIRRFSQPKESLLHRFVAIFHPDRGHIHHRLLNLGLSQREVVVLLYLVASALGCSAIGMTLADNIVGIMILTIMSIAVVVCINRLHYYESKN